MQVVWDKVVKVGFTLIMIRNVKEVRKLAMVRNVFPGFEWLKIILPVSFYWGDMCVSACVKGGKERQTSRNYNNMGNVAVKYATVCLGFYVYKCIWTCAYIHSLGHQFTHLGAVLGKHLGGLAQLAESGKEGTTKEGRQRGPWRMSSGTWKGSKTFS